MAEKYLNINGVRELVSGLRRKERTVSNTGWVDDTVPWETVILDNSSLNYTSGATFNVKVRNDVLSNSDVAKRFELIVITGANPCKIQMYEYQHNYRTIDTMQANSVYIARVYGIGTYMINNKGYGRNAYIELVRLGDVE